MQDNADHIDELSGEPEPHEEELTFEEEGEISADAIKKLRAKLKVAEHDRAEYLAGWQRAKADYINLRNAEDKAKGEIAQHTKEGLLHDFIGVLDSFDSAFANQEVWQELPQNWRLGMEHIYNQLRQTLEQHGLAEIKAAGAQFNPEEHHSIASVDVPNSADDHKVVEVTRKGYRLAGRIIRPAEVKVGIYKN
jgi:molecular chaperone GrpE